MTFTKAALITCVAISAASASFANQRAQEMPTAYLDGLNAKLISNGYRDVRVVDADKVILSAYDQSGSEVILIAHPSNNQILESHYVHGTDR